MDFPDLRNVSLAASWVLGIELGPRRLSTPLDVALMPGHALYRTPVSGEAHCYARGRLVFENLTEFHLYQSAEEASPDPDGTEDWDNLYMSELSGGRLRLESGLGLIVVAADSEPSLELETVD